MDYHRGVSSNKSNISPHFSQSKNALPVFSRSEDVKFSKGRYIFRKVKASKCLLKRFFFFFFFTDTFVGDSKRITSYFSRKFKLAFFSHFHRRTDPLDEVYNVLAAPTLTSQQTPLSLDTGEILIWPPFD